MTTDMICANRALTHIETVKLANLPLFFSAPGHRGRQPGGDGGGDPSEKAQTQEASGQGLVKQRRGEHQGQEETWAPACREALPEPAQAHQANEHHCGHSGEL